MLLIWLLLLIYVSQSRPMVECVTIPPGSIWQQDNMNYTFVAPAIAGRCQTEINGKEFHSQGFNCSGSTAYYLRYDGKYSCDGTPDVINNVIINGTCSMQKCGAYNSYDYGDPNCNNDKLVQNVTNQYIYWDPDVCYGGNDGSQVIGRIEKCVNGYAVYQEYPDTKCTGNPSYNFIGNGSCIQYGKGSSYKAVPFENGC